MSEVKRYTFKGAAGTYVYSADYDAAIADHAAAIGREVALQARLAEAEHLLHTASIRLARWLDQDDDPRKEIIAFLSGDEPSKAQVQKACPACDGWGTISTGIDEAPSTNCKKCDGTGKGSDQ
jgi:hypothetical protein